MTPAFVHDEVENSEDLIVAKSGMEPDRVVQFINLLFQYIEIVPADDFYPAIETAEAAIGDTDPDDVLYPACAIASDAAIWSDDSDSDEQNIVNTYSTSDVINYLTRSNSADPSLSITTAHAEMNSDHHQTWFKPFNAGEDSNTMVEWKAQHRERAKRVSDLFHRLLCAS
nr:PIN domain-containing protein [Natrialba sp. SSL1]